MSEAMVGVNRLWSNLLAEHVDDSLTAEIVSVLGDGGGSPGSGYSTSCPTCCAVST